MFKTSPPTICSTMKKGDIVTVTGKFQPMQKTRRLQLTSIKVDLKKEVDLDNFKEFIKVELQFCQNFHNYIGDFIHKPDPYAPTLLRRLVFTFTDNTDPVFATPASTPASGQSYQARRSSAPTPASLQRTVSYPATSTSSTPRGRPLSDISNPLKRQISVPDIGTPCSIERGPEEKKAKSDHLEMYLLSLMETKKDEDKENWNGMTFQEFVDKSLHSDVEVKEAIMNLSIQRKIKSTGPHVFDFRL
uniref:RPA_C domain-containing protein n=1 Tax=Strongyloides papillosus TaxID=174720 RepID=A0A0N5B4M0_STREA